MMIDSDLVRVCDRIAAVNIIKLSDSEEFLALTMDHLTRILCQDELGVKLEDEVLLVLQKWIKHDEESRRNDVQNFSKCIRFPLVDFDKSIGVLSEIGLVSHYQSSNSSPFRRHRYGCEGVLLVAAGMKKRQPFTGNIDLTFEATTYDVNSDSCVSFLCHTGLSPKNSNGI